MGFGENAVEMADENARTQPSQPPRRSESLRAWQRIGTSEPKWVLASAGIPAQPETQPLALPFLRFVVASPVVEEAMGLAFGRQFASIP